MPLNTESLLTLPQSQVLAKMCIRDSIGSMRLINLMNAWNHEIKELMGGMGINSIEALKGNRLMLRGIGLTDKELEILGISHAGE